jgi:hypothetical protein
MRRREFITLVGAAAAWPLAARAQQPAMPVVGFLHSSSPGGFPQQIAEFRQSLKDGGFVEGQNIAIEFRWAEDQYQRLPELAAELVGRRVAAGGNISGRGGQGCNFDSTYRVLGRGRSGRGRAHCKSQPAGRQRHGNERAQRRTRREADGAAVRARAAS